ncbi:DUF1599 domain-containing protein [bacterium]|nr:DUF1599 domain-containing protein [bacterium]
MKESTDELVKKYDEIISETREIMIRKNHDYGDSWREMRVPSITDQILVKVRRVQQLEELAQKGEKSKVAEGRISEYRDIINYCVFAVIKLRELGVEE